MVIYVIVPNTSLQANIARNSLQIVVVAKQAADAKNAWYICKNNTLSFGK